MRACVCVILFLFPGEIRVAIVGGGREGVDLAHAILLRAPPWRRYPLCISVRAAPIVARGFVPGFMGGGCVDMSMCVFVRECSLVAAVPNEH